MVFFRPRFLLSPRRLAAPVLQPIEGITTGRNILSQFNGSMTVDDIFDMYAAVLLNGFVPGCSSVPWRG